MVQLRDRDIWEDLINFYYLIFQKQFPWNFEQFWKSPGPEIFRRKFSEDNFEDNSKNCKIFFENFWKNSEEKFWKKIKNSDLIDSEKNKWKFLKNIVEILNTKNFATFKYQILNHQSKFCNTWKWFFSLH